MKDKIKQLEIVKIKKILRKWFFITTFIAVDMIDDHLIYKEENRIISHAILRRRQEFSTGRWLARKGLRYFGKKQWPVLMGDLRNPIWPKGLIGSITHDGYLCAVILESKFKILTFGIDLIYLIRHKDKKKFYSLKSMITVVESELLAIKMMKIEIDPLMLLFSVKESIIKAVSHKIKDFIDMRSIVLYYHHKLCFKIFDYFPEAEIFAFLSKNYLVSAVKILH